MSVLVAVTVACGITAPLPSSTVPEMLPPTAAWIVKGSPGRRLRIRKKKTDLAIVIGVSKFFCYLEAGHLQHYSGPAECGVTML